MTQAFEPSASSTWGAVDLPQIVWGVAFKAPPDRHCTAPLTGRYERITLQYTVDRGNRRNAWCPGTLQVGVNGACTPAGIGLAQPYDLSLEFSGGVGG
jgi:hypothetical protein